MIYRVRRQSIGRDIVGWTMMRCCIRVDERTMMRCMHSSRRADHDALLHSSRQASLVELLRSLRWVDHAALVSLT